MWSFTLCSRGAAVARRSINYAHTRTHTHLRAHTVFAKPETKRSIGRDKIIQGIYPAMVWVGKEEMVQGVAVSRYLGTRIYAVPIKNIRHADAFPGRTRLAPENGPLSLENFPLRVSHGYAFQFRWYFRFVCIISDKLRFRFTSYVLDSNTVYRVDDRWRGAIDFGAMKKWRREQFELVLSNRFVRKHPEQSECSGAIDEFQYLFVLCTY